MRIGLIGLGRIGAFHAETLSRLPSVTSLVVTDAVPAAARAVAERLDVEIADSPDKLLAELVRHAGKVLTHRHLLKEVWGPGSVSESHYLRVYMGQLRHKLEDDPAQPRYLLTEIGVGYRLRAE